MMDGQKKGAIGDWLKREVRIGFGVGVGVAAVLVEEISTGFDLEPPSISSASAFSILATCRMPKSFVIAFHMLYVQVNDIYLSYSE